MNMVQWALNTLAWIVDIMMFPSVFGGLALLKLGTGWPEAGDFLNGGTWRSSPQHLEQLELNRHLRGLPMRSRPDDRYIRGIVERKN